MPDIVLSGWEGKENDDGQLRYGSSFLFQKGEQLLELKAAATRVMEEKFGPDKTKWPKGFHKPWKDQADKDPNNPANEGQKTYAGYESGGLYLDCNSADKPPQVVDHNVKDILDKRLVYSGCYGIPNISVYYFERKNKAGAIVKQGISTALNCFQKTRDGEPLGSAPPKAADVFKPVKVDATKGAASVFNGSPAEEDEDPMA